MTKDMNRIKIFSTLLCAVAGSLPFSQNSVLGQGLLINELMQSNIDCIMDDQNEFPDSWVELYNGSEATVNLKDYKIGITDKAKDAWQLPSQNVAPKQYALVYCDKAATGLHTDFRLESGKNGEVYLFKAEEIADKVTKMKKQPAPNIAYGRKTDGDSQWGYQLQPTPKAANTGSICDQDHILGEPVFSELGKVVRAGQSLRLSLSLPDGTPEGTEIRYTTDGSEPTKSSNRYGTPLTIGSNRIVRAKLFCDGWLSPRSTTQSYIFFSSRDLTMPLVSIATNNKFLNDATIGILVDGSYQNGKKNYEFNWRRPVNIEFFFGENENSSINQLCETRVAGGATRGNKLKTLAIYANKRFGTKRFSYEFFPDQRPGITDFKSLMLRNAGNDFDYLYMRDAIIQRNMAQHTDLDWQAWRPAIVYINGVYKGMLNIRERSNEDNIYTNYDGLEDIDMIENMGELKEGDWENYNRFKAFYNEHGHTMKEYEQWMDCHEFMNLMIMNLYYNNQDFPGNNNVVWRPRASGGRWRWIAKDTDFGLGLYGSPANYKTLEWLHTPGYDKDRNWGANSYEATRLFRRLMEDQDFKREFIDRCAIYMGDFLNGKGTRAVWDPMYEQIKTEITYHRKLYTYNPWWPRNYTDELADARNWLSLRTEEFYTQLGEFYSLGTPVPLIIKKETGGSNLPCFIVNGVALSSNVFNGKFYVGRSLTIEKTMDDGQAISGWKVQKINNSTATTTEYAGDKLTLTMPQCSTLIISAIGQDLSGIDNQQSAHYTWTRNDTQLTLTGTTAGTHIVLYDLRGIPIAEATSTGADIVLPVMRNKLYLLKIGNEVIKL